MIYEVTWKVLAVVGYATYFVTLLFLLAVGMTYITPIIYGF